ncbi:uncharacterized protein ELE39_000353 [Cryptosporidium sp. chipmunk genotype I]|uniref:uncharacterized protein n=1 Tax=Cryptosporidium sp. chipmunk genotype I TaxID=1280935 RepID=UPI00351AAA96|nr:hypothetical protein ELE39_000353 [Cryptosporidium sp. chipmunk genotype I]
MTISKRELRSFFGSLHPLDVGLVFRVYKKLNYNDIQFDKLSVRRNKHTTKSSDLVNKHIRGQKSNKIRIKYLEFVKYLAENIFEMNIKDLGYLQSSELRVIFQYIKENELSINKMYNSYKLEELIFSILKIHIIYILESSILLSEISEIKTLIEDLSKLLLYLEVNVEDLFHNINKDELIQIFNLICYFSDLKEKVILEENLDNMLIRILDISMKKIKNHFNILLQHSLNMNEIISQPNQSKWISLLNSENIVISNEDLILYFILKNFNGYYCDNLKQVMQIIRFNFLSDSARSVYNRIQRPVLNSSNLSRSKYFVNNALITSNTIKKPEFIILNGLSNDSQLPTLNKHLVIYDNLNTDGCFSYVLEIMSQGKFRCPGNFNDLVKTWHLFLGFLIKTDQKFHPFAFNLSSFLCENSNKNQADKLFHCRSILKSSKVDFITENISKNMVPAPAVISKEKNCMQDKMAIQDGIVLTDINGNEILRDENRVIFVVNWREKFILVEIGGLFSVYVEILDSLFEYIGLQAQNRLIFPLISYNNEYFNVGVNYYCCNLSINEEQTDPKERHNREYGKLLAGSKTRRKVLIDVSKKQSGAPKRVTRLRPSGSTNIVIPFSLNPSNSPPFSISSPTGRRGRPRKNTSQGCIRELTYMNNTKEYYTSSFTKALNKNDERHIPESTKARDSNSLIIKKIKKKVRTNGTDNNCYFYFNSFLERFFINSFKKLLGFFRGNLV